MGEHLPDPGIVHGAYRVLLRADMEWIVYDGRRPLGRQTVATAKTVEEAEAKAVALASNP